MRKPKYLASGELSEQSIQQTVMQFIRLHPHVHKLVIHTPNEGKRSLRTGRLLKELGMRSGVSDLLIAMACHGYHGAWIELKSAKGKLSATQKEFMEDMKGQGYFTAVCYSIDEAIETIKRYCSL